MISRRSSKPPTQPRVPLWMHDSHWCRVAANASLCPQESQLELILSPGRLLSQNLLYGPSCCPKRAMLCFYEKILPVAYHSTPSAIPSLGFLSSTLLCWLFTMMFHTMSFGSFSIWHGHPLKNHHWWKFLSGCSAAQNTSEMRSLMASCFQRDRLTLCFLLQPDQLPLS